MSEGAPPPSPKQQLRDLMGRATLARVRGEHEQALKLAHEALVLDEQSWEVHEFIGDMLMEIGRGADALTSYKRAWALNPKRLELEDKVARAAARYAARQDQTASLNAMLEGRTPKEPTRQPVVAALLSLLLPGLGQLYNWHIAKAAAFAIVYFVLIRLIVSASAAQYRLTHDYAAVLKAAGVWVAVAAVLLLLSAAEAAVAARKTEAPGPTPPR